MPKRRRPPTVAYTLLTDHTASAMYRRLRELIDRYHGELREARIALGFCTAWKLDVDGIQKLGMARRASDLDRELHAWDFVLLFNREFWEHPQTTAIVRDALLDHELTHCTVRRDPETHAPMENDRGKILYRIRKHDLEEFTVIVQRYGIYRHEIDAMARACAIALQQPKLPLEEERSGAAPDADAFDQVH